MNWESSCPISLPTLGVIRLLFILAILLGMKWYLIVALNCMFLMTNDVELLFMGLLAIPRSSFVKFFFKSFAHFLLSFLLSICRKSLYILDESPLSAICIVNTFSQWLTYSCIRINGSGTFLVAQWLRISCQCRGHGFEPWSSNIPHAAEQLSPCATPTEPAL